MHFALWLLLSLFLVHGDDGVGIDPHGGRYTVRGDDGIGIDPNGGRVGGLSSAGDKGLGVDPNG